MVAMTRAVVFDRYGPPEVLRLAEVVPVELEPGQVRVAVRAAGVQPFDYKIRRGDLARYRPLTFPSGLGNEYAGVVTEVGPQVTGWRVGDEVLGSVQLAGYGEQVIVAADTVVRKPAELDFPLAAGLVAAAQTASGALLELGVGSGDTVLIHAAAGGVGTLAVQLARHAGATVIGTASEANHEYLRRLGAVPVAYGPGLARRVRALAPQGVHAALDAAGGEAAQASIDAGVPAHRIVSIADPTAPERLGIRQANLTRSPRRLAEVVALAAAGKVELPIRQYAFEQVIEAHRDAESTHGRGKIVLVR